MALLFLLAGCGLGSAVAPADGTPGARPIATLGQPLPASGAAAIVNGQPIPMATYQAQLEAAVTGYTQQPGVDPNSADGQAALAALRQQVLDLLIDQVLIDQAAARQGVTVADAQLDAEVERIRNQNPTGFAGWLKANGFTEETFRAQTRSDLLAAALRDVVTRDVSGTVEQIHVRHILVDSADEARELMAQLQAGADFQALAKARSRDEATRDQGGDLGFVPRGVLPAGVEEAAFALQPGQTGGPVESPTGWHLVQLVARDPARDIPPDILQDLRREAFMRWLDGERTNAKVERFVGE